MGLSTNTCGKRHMPTAKERIYQLILESGKEGKQTQSIADTLQIKRPNVSSILNQLTNEGKIIKTKTRPVVYMVAENEPITSDTSCFHTMIGYDGSLQKAVQIAKAAILYPQGSLHTIIVAEPGAGTTYLVSQMVQFARDVKVLGADASFVKLNCSHYSDNPKKIHHELFGRTTESFRNRFEEAKNGVLFIDKAELLDCTDQSAILQYAETGNVTYDQDDESDLHVPKLLLIIACSVSANAQVLNNFTSKIPMQITLPSLSQRPKDERMQLIDRFLSIESTRAKMKIEVDDETVRALLLYACNVNVKQLNSDIKAGCANAYVRTFTSHEKNIRIYLKDFPNYVQKGLLSYKQYQREVDSIVKTNAIYVFDSKSTLQKYTNFRPVSDVYLGIQQRFHELEVQGFQQEDITRIVNAYVDNQFRSYVNTLTKQIINTDQLSKLVDGKIITFVREFIEQCEDRFSKHYPPSVFYGLCLHINALLNTKQEKHAATREQTENAIKNHNDEYSMCLSLSDRLRKEYKLELSIDDIVIMTMFLTNIQQDVGDPHPQLLICMHGNSTASSLTQVINDLCKADNIYAYDMPLTQDTREAYDQVKALVQKIDQGAGVLVIYDMGSFRTMFQSISDDTGICIRMLNIPVTLLGVDIARKCTMETDIENIYHSSISELASYKESYSEKPHIFITLCNTGEGGAQELSDYIQKYSKLGYRTIPLSISDRRTLIREVETLKESNQIDAFVGTYNPRLFGIRFVSIQSVFECETDQLDRILQGKPVSGKEDVFNKMYQYLDESLSHVPSGKMKQELPPVIITMDEYFGLNDEQKIGLSMHIACVIDRLLDHQPVSHTADTERLQNKYPEQFKTVARCMKRIEKKFSIIIPDNEIAIILEIIGFGIKEG
ncbi:MAG: PRD domain-containing protein [Erysipelotrichia bacterium]|nr:PRD domain-containing protein [Erysipelotrichia bacterium]